MLEENPEGILRALQLAVAMVTVWDNCGTGKVDPSREMSAGYATH